MINPVKSFLTHGPQIGFARKVEMWKPGKTENQCENQDHPEVDKSEMNQKPKSI